MSIIHLATVSLNQTPLEWQGNYDRIISALKELAKPEKPGGPTPDLVLFPELVLTGYGCEDLFHSRDLIHRAYNKLSQVATESARLLPDTAILIGLPWQLEDRTYNTMALLYNGQIKGVVPKAHLAGDGVHYEPRWFSPFTNSYKNRIIELNGEKIPFGRILFQLRNTNICLEICEDSWVADRPALTYIDAGLDIILNPAASHFAFGKHRIRRNIALHSSRTFAALFMMVNLLGCESGRMIYDGGSIGASNGDLLLETDRFSFSDHIISRLSYDSTHNQTLRTRLFSYRDINQYSGEQSDFMTVKVDSDTVSSAGSSAGNSSKLNPTPVFNQSLPLKHSTPKEEEFARAVALALFDYFRKSRSSGFVISLSGGTDSAVCAILCHRMLLYAATELGSRTTLERLGISKQISEEMKRPDFNKLTPAEFAHRLAGLLIHTIYQATENSSTVTRSASQALADALGAHHSSVDVQELVDIYQNKIESILSRQLSWERDDLSLQNIQARVRSPLAWFLANTTNSLLITTSNRSEAAVGYCTMDGDTSGGLAPIAGVDKAYLKRWLKHMYENGDKLGGAIPEIEGIIALEPTAELKPNSANQTDESDLMPYELLDQIERLSIRDRRSPHEIYHILCESQKDNYSAEQLKQYIQKFFRLWSNNQWKRERYAPSFHLDDENLDPKTWYRFPILSGGFSEELSEMD